MPKLITKRKVTMTNVRAVEVDGMTKVLTTVINDYVDAARPGLLEAYVRDAESRGWSVHVGDTPDAGPGGYDGGTYIPHGNFVNHDDGSVTYKPFEHRLAGSYFAASDQDWHPEDPANPDNDGVSPNNPVATAHHLGIPLSDVAAAVRQINDHPKVQAFIARQIKKG